MRVEIVPRTRRAYVKHINAHADPASALVKLRTFGAHSTWSIYWHLRLANAQSDGAAVPAATANTLHAVCEEEARPHTKSRSIGVMRDSCPAGAQQRMRDTAELPEASVGRLHTG
ncbi:MAG: hypothetical protein HC834_08975 [Rhodospirillales bacterium]|nr:hypothetical protein [Rhodospirillales bacterium]